MEKRFNSRESLLDVCEEICRPDLSRKESNDENDVVALTVGEEMDIFAPVLTYCSQQTAEALIYETGQYNPVTNRTGRKVYSRKFLLNVCEKICKLDLWCKKNDYKNYVYGLNIQNCTPTDDRNKPSRKHNNAGRGNDGQDVELKSSVNPWKSTRDIKHELKIESLKKKLRCILNKLTPSNFEKLSEAVTRLNIDIHSNIDDVMDIVFAKAVAEPGYSILYSHMCKHLNKITHGLVIFRLVSRCQDEFSCEIYDSLNLNERKEKIDKEEDPDIKKQLNEELYEDMFRCRMRGLGLIKFIGELYKIEMLNDKIMFDCVIRLLSDTSEESIECLCDLLTTIGEKLDSLNRKRIDREKELRKASEANDLYQCDQQSTAVVEATGSTSSQEPQQLQPNTLIELNQIFEQLHEIRKNKDLPLSVRIRFKILDICELREEDNWQSKKTKDNITKETEELMKALEEKQR